MLSTVFSIGPNGEFGSYGGLWQRHKDELRCFKLLTSVLCAEGFPIIAGRRTAETLPNGLKGRTCKVVGTNVEHLYPAWSPLEVQFGQDHGCVIGGVRLILEALLFADIACITNWHDSALAIGPATLYLPRELYGLGETFVSEPSFTIRMCTRTELDKYKAIYA